MKWLDRLLTAWLAVWRAVMVIVVAGFVIVSVPIFLHARTINEMFGIVAVNVWVVWFFLLRRD